MNQLLKKTDGAEAAPVLGEEGGAEDSSAGAEAAPEPEAGSAAEAEGGETPAETKA